MTEKQILEQAIKKAGHEYPMKLSGVPFDHNTAMYSIIFSHGFARAFWGEELFCYDCGGKVKPPMMMGSEIQIGTGQCDCNRQFENNEPAWEYHLQQMVIEENPIQYLEKFL